MPAMQMHIQALAQAMDWTQLAAQHPGPLWTVALENDLDAVFFALDDRTAVMRGVVCDLPADLSDQQGLLAKAAQLQVASIRNTPTILACEKEEQSLADLPDTPIYPCLICYRFFTLNNPVTVFVREVQDWLNDFAWMKDTLSGTDTLQSPQTASFSDIFSGIKI